MTDVKSQESTASGDSENASSGDKMIPFDRFKKVNDEKNSLQEQVSELLQGKNTLGVASKAKAEEVEKPQPVFTRQELNKFLDDGKISQEQMDNILDNQNQTKIDQGVKNAVGKQAQDELTSTGLTRYMTARPEAIVEGTDDRRRVTAQFNKLIEEGQPNNKATELLALKIAFGPIEALEAASVGSHDRMTHQDAGGEGGDDNVTDSSPKDLTSRQRRFYQSKIDQGIYSDWDAVKSELKYQDKNLSKRAANG
jgi:hypothetical protein